MPVRRGRRPDVRRGVPALSAGAALLLAGALAGCSPGDPGDAPSGEALGPAVPSVTTVASPASPPTSGAATEGTSPTPGPGEDGTGEDATGEDGTGQDATVAPVPPRPEVPVPPPAGEGDLQPVPTPSRPTLDPVQLDESAEAGDQLSVRLVDLEQVQVTGRGPGERSGSALAVDVEVVNDGTAPLDVPGLAVSLAYADTEASPVDGPPADQVVGPVPPRSRVTGTYVFLVPEDQRSRVLVRVGLGASQPVVVFEGRVTS